MTKSFGYKVRRKTISDLWKKVFASVSDQVWLPAERIIWREVVRIVVRIMVWPEDIEDSAREHLAND